MRFRVVLEAVIAYLTSDIQRQTEPDMDPDWLFLETFSYQVAKNYKFRHMILGKAKKCRYFHKIRQINALKETLTEAIGRQISHKNGYIIAECGNAVKRGFLSIP